MGLLKQVEFLKVFLERCYRAKDKMFMFLIHRIIVIFYCFSPVCRCDCFCFFTECHCEKRPQLLGCISSV